MLSVRYTAASTKQGPLLGQRLASARQQPLRKFNPAVTYLLLYIDALICMAFSEGYIVAIGHFCFPYWRLAPTRAEARQWGPGSSPQKYRG